MSGDMRVMDKRRPLTNRQGRRERPTTAKSAPTRQQKEREKTKRGRKQARANKRKRKGKKRDKR